MFASPESDRSAALPRIDGDVPHSDIRGNDVLALFRKAIPVSMSRGKELNRF
jgi:hypothetical protein